MKGAIIAMTGATSGLGRAAALRLAAAGAQVIAYCRDPQKGASLLDEWSKSGIVSGGDIQLATCDLASLRSVVEACEHTLAMYPRLDVLINNAGMWSFERRLTTDGIEDTFQVNVLAPLLMMRKLMPALKSSQASKIITTASALHQGDLRLNDLEFNRDFSGFKSYRQSKLAVILLTSLYAKHYGPEGLHFYTQHPGLVNTELVRGGGWFARWFFNTFGMTAEQGAETLIYLATTDPAQLENGAYYVKKKPAKTSTRTSYDLELAAVLEARCLAYLERAGVR